MQRIDIFISYKREERALAERVSQSLVSLGYIVVTDLNIQKAVDFGDAIDAMIREASLVIVLWTKESVASQWVRKEASEAERLGKYLGVRIDPVVPDDLPLAVRTNNWLDLSGKLPQDILKPIADEVRGLLGKSDRSGVAAEKASQIAEGDLEFFQVVDQVGEALGYLKYLEKYPDGALASIAQSRAKQRSGWRHTIRTLPMITLIVTLATCVAAYAAWKSIPQTEESIVRLEEDRQAALASLEDEKQRAELLNNQVSSLRAQIGALLARAEAMEAAQKVQIEELGSQLNQALARLAAEQRATIP